MPAPTPPGAALLVIELDLITARPPLAMPAPAAAPPPWVAELAAPVLASRVRLAPVGSPPLPGPLTPPPPLPAVLNVTWLELRTAVPAWFKMPPASPLVLLRVTWLA